MSAFRVFGFALGAMALAVACGSDEAPLPRHAAGAAGASGKPGAGRGGSGGMGAVANRNGNGGESGGTVGGSVGDAGDDGRGGQASGARAGGSAHGGQAGRGGSVMLGGEGGEPGGSECPPGFANDALDPGKCVDLDECAENHGGCDPVSECMNSLGSRVCGDCPPGYSGTGATGCTPINHCPCENGGVCVEHGSATVCDCPPGYFGATCAVGIVSIEMGYGYACGLLSDHTVTCWGATHSGTPQDLPGTFQSLANGRGLCGMALDQSIVCSNPLFSPSGSSFVPPSGVFASMSMGYSHACAVRENGSVECWTYSGAPTMRRATPPAGTFTSVAAGRFQTCGIHTDQSVECWADYLGPGSTDTQVGYAAIPPGGSFQAIAADEFYTCGIHLDGTPECWGKDWSDQPLPAPPSGSFTAIKVSSTYACGIRTDGSLACWGDAPPGMPTQGSYVEISTGDVSACAMTTDGRPRCWGTDLAGATTIPGGAFLAVASGAVGSCGIRADGSVQCWGAVPTTLPPPGTFTSLAFSATDEFYDARSALDFGPKDDVVCGTRLNGTVECWGAGDRGQATPPPGELHGLVGGATHFCGLLADDTIECWGSNDFGQSSPPSGRYETLGTSPTHSCAVRLDGYVDCWGTDLQGEGLPPHEVFTTVAAFEEDVGWGDAFSCGLHPDHHLECWGNGALILPDDELLEFRARGTLGVARRLDGTLIALFDYNHFLEPKIPSGEFESLSYGNTYGCAVRPDMTLACWGAQAR